MELIWHGPARRLFHTSPDARIAAAFKLPKEALFQ